jgi:hypothetical protein
LGVRNHPENGAKNFCKLHVLPQLDRPFRPERIDVGLIQAALVQIACVAEKPEVDLTFVSP